MANTERPQTTPLRRALEAVATKRVRGRRPDETAWDDAVRSAGEDVATFVRALRITSFGYRGVWRDGPGTAEDIAAEIEEAARAQ